MLEFCTFSTERKRVSHANVVHERTCNNTPEGLDQITRITSHCNPGIIMLQNARVRSNFGEMSTPQSITH